MPRLLERCMDWLWTVVAAVVIALAVLVTALRLLLPELGSQRAAIEGLITHMVGRPAVVGAIEASWSGWSPHIRVERIAIRDPASQTELIHFDRATINIDPLAFVASGGSKPQSLIVSGVALTLIRDHEGRFSVAGMPPPKSPIIQWLVRQENFAITEADLTVIDQREDETFVLRDVTVTVRGRGPNKLLSADVALPDTIGKRLSIEVAADGNPLEANWNGLVNLRLDGVNSDYLAKHLAAPGQMPGNVPVNLVAWSQWRDARLQTADFTLEALAAAGSQASLLRARGHVHRRAQGWGLEVADIALASADGSDAGGQLSAAWRNTDGALDAVAVRAESLPLTPLAAAAAQSDALEPALAATLRRAAPRGRIERIEAAWLRPATARPRYFVAATLAQVSTAAGDDIAAISDAAGQVRLHPGAGYLAFDDDTLTLSYPQHLVQPLRFTGLTGTLSWLHPDDGRHTLRTDRLRTQVEGADVTLEGGLEFNGEALPSADATIAFEHADAARLQQLLPLKVLPEHGDIWARHLLQAGRISAGHAVIKGPLEHFPYSAASGELTVDFDVSDATLQYSHEWPLATAFDGHVAVRGASVKLDIRHGVISGADIAGAEVELPDMFTHERMVRISGTARGPATSATAIIMASPLQRGKAARIRNLTIDGDLEVALDLNLALYHDGPHDVLGQARFNGNRIDAPKQNVTLDHVVGSVSFTQSDWYGEQLSAEFDGTPVGLVVNGGLDDPNYDSEFRLTGTSAAAGLLKYLHRYAPPLYDWLAANDRLDAISGELPWKAVLTIPSESGDAAALPRLLTLESSLLGLGIDLPWPLAKRADERKPLRIETAIRNHIPVTSRIDFGDTVDIELDALPVAGGAARLTRAEVLFGTEAPEFKDRPGVSFSGYVPELSLSEWTAFLQRMQATPSTPGADLPVTLDVQIGALRMLGRSFGDVRVSGARQPAAWSIDLASVDASGHVDFPRDIKQGVLRLDLDHLRLTHARAASDHPGSELDPRRLPAMQLHCDSFHFEDTDLGAADFTTTRHEDGLTLTQLTFSGPDFSIHANGDWLIAGSAHRSIFNIAVKSRTLASLLQRFGYTGTNIRRGATDIAIQASWDGTPTEFTLARLNGSFELHVTGGRLLDIEPGTGRLFGLLSLQTLPRRLLLDFEDLFEKGFAFDRIGGVFELDDGNAYTNSLLMEGPAARIDISGRIGLAVKDYDQHVVVTPALSNSLPLAGALFGPIGVGAGAVFYLGQKMFKSIPEHVNKFLSRDYSITGSWENPVVERI